MPTRKGRSPEMPYFCQSGRSCFCHFGNFLIFQSGIVLFCQSGRFPFFTNPEGLNPEGSFFINPERFQSGKVLFCQSERVLVCQSGRALFCKSGKATLFPIWMDPNQEGYFFTSPEGSQSRRVPFLPTRKGPVFANPEGSKTFSPVWKGPILLIRRVTKLTIRKGSNCTNVTEMVLRRHTKRKFSVKN